MYYTCDVNICVEIDPGTHMLCTRLCPSETGVTLVPQESPLDANALGTLNLSLECNLKQGV
jgi:hypothetical protein